MIIEEVVKMKILITEQQRKSVNEMIKLDIKVGDTLMGGKFKNKKVVVKTIGKNDKGDITINGKPLLRFRILKEDDSENRIVKIFKQWLYSNYDNIAFLENKTYDGLPLIKIYYTTDSNAVNYGSWLEGEISDEWNKLTGGQIPVIPRWKFSGYNAKIVIDTEEYDEDDDMINEDIHNNRIINRYWDKLINDGGEPSLNDPSLITFGVDISDYEEVAKLLVDYYGYDKSIEKTKQLLNELESFEIDLGDFGICYWSVTNIDEIDDETIRVEATIYGDDIYEIVDDMDMSEYFDFKDYNQEEINKVLFDKVTTKTGIRVSVDDFRYENLKSKKK